MFSFEPTFQSQQSAARCGVLKNRGNTLTTPCVFLETQAGLPTFLTIQQLSKANLPPHGYVLDLGNILYLSSTDKIHSSYSQPSKSNKSKKMKQKDNNKNNNNKNTNSNNKKDDESKTENKSNEESKKTSKDYTKTSVLDQFYENNASDSNVIKSIHKFTGMEEYILLIDHRNVIYREPQQGTDKFVVLTTDHGKKKISVEEYVNHIKNINANLYLLPSEDILSNSSKSRCQKNVNRTLKLFNDGLINHCKLNIDETTMISVISGGCNIEQRMKCCNEMIKVLSTNDYIKNKQINYGYMIGGIGYGETPKQRHEILINVIKGLNDDEMNKDKLRIINGIDTLDDVILAISDGCDVIISSYPTQLTQNGHAMIHPISPKEEEMKINDMKDEDDDIDIDIDIDINNNNNNNNGDGDIYIDKINIRDICYSTDPSPILEGCKCYSCTNHSRAYIRHLFNVHEMNAQILLQMHNSYRFLQFVENVKEYLSKDKLAEFAKWWLQYQTKIN